MEIPLTKGCTAIVDEDDYKYLSKYSWCVTNEGYAKSSLGLYMHRMVLGVGTKQYVVDHINHNKLDNRRLNLRAVKASVNCLNTTRKGVGASKHVGVYRHHSAPSWVAQFRHKHLGMFKTQELAAQAYQVAKVDYLKERKLYAN